MTDAEKEKQKHINRNNSPQGKADYLRACREVAESMTVDELKGVVSDVAEYGDVYRKACGAELTTRNKKTLRLPKTQGL